MVSAPVLGQWPRMLIYMGYLREPATNFNPTAQEHPSLQPHACEPAEGFPFIYSQQHLLSIYYVVGNMKAKDMIRDYITSMHSHRGK